MQIRTLIIWITALFLSTLAKAELQNQHFLRNFQPYIGVDGQNREMRFEELFGGNLFSKNLRETDIYGGIKLFHYFAINIGQEHSKTEDHTVTLVDGDSFLGIILEPGEGPEMDFTQTKIKGNHFDLVGYYPICPNQEIEVFASIGKIRNHLSLTQIQISQDNIPLPSPIVRTYDVKRTNWRASLGIQKTFCQHIGIRGLITWEETSKFKDLKPLEVPDTDTLVRIRSSLIYSVGIFAIL